MTDSRDLTAGERRWVALADELTPAKSLTRLDAAAARVVTTVGVVATLLTGFGLAAAQLVRVDGTARWLAIGSVILAAAAVACAIAAQAVTITRGLDVDNLVEVEDWYRTRFANRAPLTRWASLLLLAAALLAGAVAVLALLDREPDPPVLAVTRVAELTPDGTLADAPTTLTLEVRFTGLEAGDVVTVTVSVGPTAVARAALTPDADGAAARTLTVPHLTPGAKVRLEADGGGHHCTGTLTQNEPTHLTC